MKKRTIEKGNGSQQVKRGRNLGQQSRSRSHNAYMQQPLAATPAPSTVTGSSPCATIVQNKGARKGKGRGAA
jgi:hypothetical protein